MAAAPIPPSTAPAAEPASEAAFVGPIAPAGTASVAGPAPREPEFVGPIAPAGTASVEGPPEPAPKRTGNKLGQPTPVEPDANPRSATSPAEPDPEPEAAKPEIPNDKSLRRNAHRAESAAREMRRYDVLVNAGRMDPNDKRVAKAKNDYAVAILSMAHQNPAIKDMVKADMIVATLRDPDYLKKEKDLNQRGLDDINKERAKINQKHDDGSPLSKGEEEEMARLAVREKELKRREKVLGQVQEFYDDKNNGIAEELRKIRENPQMAATLAAHGINTGTPGQAAASAGPAGPGGAVGAAGAAAAPGTPGVITKEAKAAFSEAVNKAVDAHPGLSNVQKAAFKAGVAEALKADSPADIAKGLSEAVNTLPDSAASKDAKEKFSALAKSLSGAPGAAAGTAPATPGAAAPGAAGAAKPGEGEKKQGDSKDQEMMALLIAAIQKLLGMQGQEQDKDKDKAEGKATALPAGPAGPAGPAASAATGTPAISEDAARLMMEGAGRDGTITPKELATLRDSGALGVLANAAKNKGAADLVKSLTALQTGVNAAGAALSAEELNNTFRNAARSLNIPMGGASAPSVPVPEAPTPTTPAPEAAGPATGEMGPQPQTDEQRLQKAEADLQTAADRNARAQLGLPAEGAIPEDRQAAYNAARQEALDEARGRAFESADDPATQARLLEESTATLNTRTENVNNYVDAAIAAEEARTGTPAGPDARREYAALTGDMDNATLAQQTADMREEAETINARNTAIRESENQMRQDSLNNEIAEHDLNESARRLARAEMGIPTGQELNAEQQAQVDARAEQIDSQARTNSMSDGRMWDELTSEEQTQRLQAAREPLDAKSDKLETTRNELEASSQAYMDARYGDSMTAESKKQYAQDIAAEAVGAAQRGGEPGTPGYDENVRTMKTSMDNDTKLIGESRSTAERLATLERRDVSKAGNDAAEDTATKLADGDDTVRAQIHNKNVADKSRIGSLERLENSTKQYAATLEKMGRMPGLSKTELAIESERQGRHIEADSPEAKELAKKKFVDGVMRRTEGKSEREIDDLSRDVEQKTGRAQSLDREARELHGTAKDVRKGADRIEGTIDNNPENLALNETRSEQRARVAAVADKLDGDAKEKVDKIRADLAAIMGDNNVKLFNMDDSAPQHGTRDTGAGQGAGAVR